VVEIQNIANLWDSKFAFKYDPTMKDEIKVDDLEFYEKQQDELRNCQRAKWVDL
jgi:hypothetical protein